MTIPSTLTCVSVSAAVVIGLAGCGGGSSSNVMDPAPPGPTALSLPAGHSGLAAGTLSIPAGRTVRRGNVRFTCRSTTDCTVELSSSVGTLTATMLGRVTAMVSPDDPPGPTDPETADAQIRAQRTNDQIRQASGIVILDWRRSAEENTPTGPLPPLPNDRRGEPLHDRMSDSITQSSTVHAADMRVGVGAAYVQADAPPGNSDLYTSNSERTTTVTVQGVWQTRDNESDEWSSYRTMTRANEEAGLFYNIPGWVDDRTVELGGRELHINLHTDIDNTKAANSYLLPGLDEDRDAGDEDVEGLRPKEGTMHADWRSGGSSGRNFVDRNIIRFESPSLQFVNSQTDPGNERVDFRPGQGAGGWYRGIEGTFVCTTADGCHIRNEVLEEGVTVRGDFEFRPDSGQREHTQTPTAPTDSASMPTRGGNGGTAGRLITVMEAGQSPTDPDWLAIGTWRVVPNDIHGDYEVGAFADGNDPFIAANIQALQGIATYTGRAFGEYARVLPEDSTRAQRGTFDASASLQANFGSAADLGTISGRVNGFAITPEGGSRVGNLDWDLRLENAGIGRPNPLDGVSGPNNAFESDTSGFADGHALEGRWGGRFFGNDRDDYGVLTGNQTVYPGSVAGTFGAAMKDGPADNNYDLNLIGAFGAHRGAHR